MKGREEEREKPLCVVASHTRPLLGPGLQPRPVPWQGMEPMTLWFTGWHSIHWATPARANSSLSYLFILDGKCTFIYILIYHLFKINFACQDHCHTIRSIYLVFVLGSWPKASKTLVISWDRSISSYSYQVPFNHSRVYAQKVTLGRPLDSFRMGTHCQGNQPCN